MPEDTSKTGSRGTESGKPDKINQGLAEPDKSKVFPAQAAAEAPAKAIDKSRIYTATALRLVEYFKSIPVTRGKQLTKDETRRKDDFLTDDTKCDCSKFVIKALLNADNVDYQKSTYNGITVPAFCGAKVADITAVDGMISVINNLMKANKTDNIRPTDPKAGDLIFWGGHVGLVTDVSKGQQDILVSFAAMGNTSANVNRNIPLEGTLRKETANNYTYGIGGFKGFWTPCQ